MIPTGSSSPDNRPISTFDLALDIARELRSGDTHGKRWEEIIEVMLRAALKNGGIRA